MPAALKWNVEPVTSLRFTNVVDLGEVQEGAIEELARACTMCVVTGCTEDRRTNKSDQIRYDIVPVAQMLAYLGQCRDRADSDVFFMSAYPARNLRQARLKVRRLDQATTGGQQGYQSKPLWNPPHIH